MANLDRDYIVKAQPTASTVHVNAALTNVSIIYMQKEDQFIATKVFPTIPVDKQSDLYWTYTKNDWFRDEAQPRSPGTESAGGGYDLDCTANYFCNVVAFHKDIPDRIRDNADNALDMDRDATNFVTQKLMLYRERKWHANYFTTSKWGKDYTGVASSEVAGTSFRKWSDYSNSDPVCDIKNGRMYIKSVTGYKPNTLVLQEEVFEALKLHPDIIDRYKYTSSKVITAELLAALFEVDRLVISGATYATNNEGGAEAYSYIGGKAALLCYSAPAPGLLQPSAGYTFAWKGMSGMGSEISITTLRADLIRSDRIEGELAFDCKKVAADLGVFFATAIA